VIIIFLILNNTIFKFDQSKFEEEIKKILKKALISAHENSKNEVNELIKKNEQFLDEFKNSIIQNQENNNHKILLLYFRFNGISASIY
jgi:TRAP-type C4-dicarboxylate transport system substrate-binding protein